MKQYYKVSYKQSENIYCSNIAYAESREDVKAHYSKYEWVGVAKAAAYEVENAQRKGIPIIEVEHIEPAEEDRERLNAEWISYLKSYRLYRPSKPQDTVAYVDDLEEVDTEKYDLVLCDADTMHMELIYD